MLTITYQTDLGALILTDQYAQNRIVQLDGFEYVSPNYHTATDNFGQRTLDATPAPRSMGVRFELHYDGNMDTLKQKRAELSVLCSKPGVLTVTRFGVSRKIDVQQVTLAPSDRNGIWQDYVIQFVADQPYFHDAETQSVSVYGKTDLLTDTFTFPTDHSGIVFTTLTNQTDIVISGSEPTRPIFRLYCPEAGTGSGVTITNQTTGVSITLNLTPTAGEIITIDTTTGDITSTVDGDRIAALDLTSFLSKFLLEPGTNLVGIVNNAGGVLYASCDYTNNYVEAGI